MGKNSGLQNAPSQTGNKSGGGRGNNPPRGGRSKSHSSVLNIKFTKHLTYTLK